MHGRSSPPLETSSFHFFEMHPVTTRYQKSGPNARLVEREVTARETSRSNCPTFEVNTHNAIRRTPYAVVTTSICVRQTPKISSHCKKLQGEVRSPSRTRSTQSWLLSAILPLHAAATRQSCEAYRELGEYTLGYGVEGQNGCPV